MNTPLSLRSGTHSLFQSALSHILKHKGSDTPLAENHDMMQQANQVLQAHKDGQDLDGFLGTPLQCASLTVQAAMAFVEGNREKEALLRAQVQDSPCDALGWTSALLAYEDYYQAGRDPVYTTWKDIGDFVYPLPEKPLTVGILADWGTGDPAVAATSLKALFKFKPDLIVHLGDIYYAGTEEECTDNFLNYLVQACNENYKVPVWNMTGNHDYYSGGQGFYQLLTKLNPQCAPAGAPVQEASFFCLRNANWQIQAMDTGYGDHDLFTVSNDTTQLQPSEVQWHLDKIATAGSRRIILLSHHQLYSAFTHIGAQTGSFYNPNLLRTFQPAMNSGQVVAWLWGHEHLLEIYADVPVVGAVQPKGRCIGHSAFPMLTSSDPYKVVAPPDEIPLLGTPPFLDTTQDVFDHGFTILTLADTYAQADYYQLPGDGTAPADPLNPKFSETLWYTEAASAAGGTT